jgi:hypothetical protein
MANPKKGQLPKVQRGGEGGMQLSNDGRNAQGVRKLPTRGSVHDRVSMKKNGRIIAPDLVLVVRVLDSMD